MTSFLTEKIPVREREHGIVIRRAMTTTTIEEATIMKTIPLVVVSSV